MKYKYLIFVLIYHTWVVAFHHCWSSILCDSLLIYSSFVGVCICVCYLCYIMTSRLWICSWFWDKICSCLWLMMFFFFQMCFLYLIVSINIINGLNIWEHISQPVSLCLSDVCKCKETKTAHRRLHIKSFYLQDVRAPSMVGLLLPLNIICHMLTCIHLLAAALWSMTSASLRAPDTRI